MCLLNALKWVPGEADKIASDVREDLDKWFEFFVRMSKESQAMFIEAVMTSGSRAESTRAPAYRLRAVMTTHAGFKKWATENHYLF